MAAVVDALKGSSITYLNLSMNKITDVGMAALAPKLLELPDFDLLFAGVDQHQTRLATDAATN